MDVPAEPRTHDLPAEAPGGDERRFAWLVTGTSFWILAGLYLDGWFHLHRDTESFFTPWHAVLYSGVAASAAVHVHRWVRGGGLPPGYGASLAGLGLVGVAGAADLAWHTALGVEADLAALLSPPHLLLIAAGVMGVAGPLRAALRVGPTAGGGLPAALSVAFVVTGLAFFTQYGNPFTHLYPVAGWDNASGTVLPTQQLSSDAMALREVVGVSGVVLLAVLLGGAVAVLHSRTALARGGLLVAVAVPVAFVIGLRGTWFLLPGVLAAAFLTEVAGRRAGTAPVAGLAAGGVALSWVLTLAAAYDLAWSAELLTGSVVSAAGAGWLAGWLVGVSHPASPRCSPSMRRRAVGPVTRATEVKA